MNTFLRTGEFDEWLTQLKDKIGKARIMQRLDAAIAGNFGDCELSAKGFRKCAFMLALVIGFTTRARVK